MCNYVVPKCKKKTLVFFLPLIYAKKIFSILNISSHLYNSFKVNFNSLYQRWPIKINLHATYLGFMNSLYFVELEIELEHEYCMITQAQLPLLSTIMQCCCIITSIKCQGNHFSNIVEFLPRSTSIQYRATVYIAQFPDTDRPNKPIDLSPTGTVCVQINCSALLRQLADLVIHPYSTNSIHLEVCQK